MTTHGSHMQYRSYESPHPPQAGDLKEYYIGHIYERFAAIRSGRYEQSCANDGPYLKYIRRLVVQGWPQFQYLADFMDTSTVPIKSKLLVPSDKLERSGRTHVSVIDLNEDGEIHTTSLDSHPELVEFLDQHAENKGQGARLLIVEDLSSQVIETLGSRYDIDPQAFRDHLGDYIWYHAKDPWFDTPLTRSRVSRHNHIRVRFAQPRCFTDPSSIGRAKAEAGSFNVLRRIDFDTVDPAWRDAKDLGIGLVRSSATVWIRPRSIEPKGWLGVILVDPLITEGYPIWGGYAHMNPPPSMLDGNVPMSDFNWSPGRHDLTIWIKLLQRQHADVLRIDPEYLISPLFELIASQYLLLFEHISARLSQIEWKLEFEPSSVSRSLDATLNTFHPWRRRMPIYKAFIESILSSLRRRHSIHAPEHWMPVIQTFEESLDRHAGLQTRANTILSILTAVISIEEAKKASENARSITRITYLAFIFVPLSFVSSFLSMNTEFASGSTAVYWTYFSIAIPMSILTILIAYKWSSIMRWSSNFSLSRSKTR